MLGARATTLVIALAACSPESDANPDIFVTKEGDVLLEWRADLLPGINARFRAKSATKTEYPCDIFGRVSVGQ